MTLLEHDPAPPVRTRPQRRSLRPLLTRLHFYAGILVGPFIVLAAITGGLYAVTPQLEQVVHADQLTTDSRGPALSLDDQIAAARTAEPELPLLAVRPAAEEGMTTRVLFDDGRTEQSRRLAVFVDPVDGEVQGTLTSYGGSGSLPVRTWIDELHRNLHLGEPGRVYSELAASWLGVVAVAGLLLWWTGRRTTRSRLRPDSSAKGRRRTLSWHGAVGTWLVLGMVMLSATGLTWSRFGGANVSELRTALGWNAPTLVTETGDHAAHGDGGHSGHGGGSAGSLPGQDGPGIGYQGAADAAGPLGLTGPLEVQGPAGESGTYVVSQIATGWPTQADVASVAPADGEVVDVVRFADHPFVAKLATWGIDLHMGVLFGVPNQVGLLILAGGIVAMTVLGYRMWWQRRPTRGRGRVGRPARRGAWRSVHPAVLALVAVGAVALGWFLPVLGLSLLGFLLVDAVLGRRAARTAAPAG